MEHSQKAAISPSMDEQQLHSALDALVVKCQTDSSLGQQLLADTAATLASHGIAVPAGVRVQVYENSPDLINLVLPVQPAGLSDRQLDQVAGGIGRKHSFS